MCGITLRCLRPPLIYRRCDKCSLSGEGAIDGRARHWLAAAPSEGNSGRQIQAAKALEGQASLSVLQGEGQREALQASGDDPPRKKVHNWQDASCPNSDECRCGERLSCGVRKCHLRLAET